MKPAPRRRFLISSLQVRLLAINTAYMLALTFGLGMVLFAPLIRRMQDETLSGFERSEASSQLLVLYVRLWPGLALFGFLFLLHQVIISHRVAGPLYRIRATLKKVTEGVLLERMKLREHDLLIEDEEAVNEMLDSLRTRIQHSRESAGEMRSAIATLEDGAGSGDLKSKAEWTRLCASLARLEGELQAFDLGGTSDQRRQSSGQASPPEALPRGRSREQHAEAGSSEAA